MKFSREGELIQWALNAGRLGLFLDYDGTLVDFSPTPDRLDPDPKVVNLLGRIAKKPNICTAVISGRRLHDLRMLLPIQGLYLGGTYGLELFTPSGETVYRADYAAVRPVLETIKRSWELILSGRSGFFLEDKGWSLALHARFAGDVEAAQVFAAARRAVDPEKLAGRFRILGGHKFLEVAPLLASKREAVLYLLSQSPFSGARCLYIGDDDKDEEAFPVIHEHGGAAVKVAQPSQSASLTAADYIFESPKETIHWLESLVSRKNVFHP